MTVIPSHCCKETPIGPLNAEKTAEALCILDCIPSAPLNCYITHYCVRPFNCVLFVLPLRFQNRGKLIILQRRKLADFFFNFFVYFFSLCLPLLNSCPKTSSSSDHVPNPPLLLSARFSSPPPAHLSRRMRPDLSRSRRPGWVSSGPSLLPGGTGSHRRTSGLTQSVLIQLSSS